MFRLEYLLIFTCFLCISGVVYGSENATFSEVPVDTLVNLTGNNELWTVLLKDCQEPTLTCVQNNIFNYLKQTLDETSDIQFTSFLKFSKNALDYNKIERSFDLDSNDTEEFYEDEFPIESMSRSLQENTAKFFMTHDLEVSLPDGIFPNSVLKIAPRGLENHGALVNLEIVSKDLEAATGLEENRTFKKIRKFINEKLIYALLAILLVVKLLAVKFLFLLPLLIGAATAKKLLLKILLFVFPFLHHIFKFCAYYPIQAKFHHHKHLISHIHEISPHKHHDHHDVEVIGPHAYGPPPIEHHGHHDEHFTELDDDVSVFPDDGSGFPHGLISHRKDPFHADNEINGQIYKNRRRPNRPLSSSEIQRVLAKAEKEAIIKARLEKERIRIREENLRLQEHLNQAIKLQEKLKHQAIYLNKKLPPTKIVSSVPYNHKPSGTIPARIKGPPLEINSPILSEGPGIDLPPGYIPEHTVPQRPQTSHQFEPNQFDQQYQTVQQDHFEQQYQESIQNNYAQQFQPSQINIQPPIAQIAPNPGPVYKSPQLNTQLISSGSSRKPVTSSAEVDFQQSIEYDPRVGAFDNNKGVQSTADKFPIKNNPKPIETFEKPTSISKPTPGQKPKLEQEIHQAASITFDQFYSPILQKIDKILEGLGFIDEPCRERLICSMYKNPSKFSPHSNLLSAELSRDSSELQKPSSTNSAVIRFYKYVQAARDGQDQRDCLRLYPTCSINTDVS